MEASNKPTLFQELLRRRVFQIVGVYLGAIFALVEFTGNLAERYQFNDIIVDWVLVGMLCMLPAIVMLAWRLGAPGKDQWTRVERVGVPANAFVTLCILLFLLPNQDHASAKQQVEQQPPLPVVTNETGTSQVVSLQLFFVEPEQTSTTDHWLSYALHFLMASDLSQDNTISQTSFYDQFEGNNFWQVKRAGFKDGLKVPLALAQSIAQDSLNDYFARASYQVTDNGYRLAVTIYQTDNRSTVAQFTTENSDPVQLAEQATQLIRQSLQPIHGRTAQPLNQIPLPDLVTSNIDALKVFVEGMNSLLFDNNYEDAKTSLQQAVELDPSFALAYLKLGDIYAQQGQKEPAVTNLQKVLNQSYKLTDRTRLTAKAYIYQLNDQVDAQQEVFRSWIQLFPNDHEPKNRLAKSMIWQGNRVQEAIELYQQSLETAPQQPYIYNELGNLHYVVGDHEKAIEYYQKFFEFDPSSYLPLISIGNIERRVGNLENARKNYMTASVISTDMVTPVLTISDLDFREGKLNQAEQRIIEARAISQAPRQLALILEYEANQKFYQGKPTDAVALLEELQQVLPQFENPIEAAFRGFLTRMYMYSQAGQSEFAEAKLVELEAAFEGNFKALTSYGYAFLYLAENQPDKAEIHLKKINQVVDVMRLNHLIYLSECIEGMIAQKRGDYATAARLLAASKDSFYQSAASLNHTTAIDFVSVQLIENLRLKGDTQQALNAADDFLKEWPYNPYANLQVAWLYQEQGNQVAAQKYLNLVFEVWSEAEPGFEPLSEAQQLAEQLTNKAAQLEHSGAD